MREAATAAPYEPPEIDGAPYQQRPVIEIGTDLPRMVDQLEAAMTARSDLGLYQRNGKIVRVLRDAPPPARLRREHGAVTIGTVNPAHLIECAARAALWAKYDGRKKSWTDARPDHEAVNIYLARGAWGLRPLAGIVTGPTLREDGSILDAPDYDAATGLYLASDGASYPALPDRPSHGDASRALAALLEVFRDFPFVADVDRAGALAALLTVVSRAAIPGCVPAFPASATAPGTGKTVLVDAISVIATGTAAPKIPQSDSDEETRKVMLSVALAGDQLVNFDNLHLPFGGAAIDLAITAGTIRDRILGASEMASASWRAVIFATGQNLAYKGDIARRVIPIRLDAEIEHPERRTGFAHPALLEWVAAERPRLLMAALTVLRAYVVAGRPGESQLPQLGSFSGWALVRGALAWLGQPDPAECQAGITTADDEDRQSLVRLLTAWRDEFGPAARTIAEALAAERSTTLHDAVTALDPRFDGRGAPNTRRIARAFRRHARRVVGGLRLVSAGDDGRGVAQWRVEGVGP